MSSGERPIGAAKGKQPTTEALCQPHPPCIPIQATTNPLVVEGCNGLQPARGHNFFTPQSCKLKRFRICGELKNAALAEFFCPPPPSSSREFPFPLYSPTEVPTPPSV